MSPFDLFVAGTLVLATAALGAMAGITLLNLATFPRLRRVDPGRDVRTAGTPAPPVVPDLSILVPARDEAATIGATVAGLLDQPGVALELLVLDDGSTDGTAEVARAAARGDPRLRVLTGTPLPAGWAGKPWACAQLAAAARAPLLLFTDADTRWSPGALAALLAARERTGAGLLTAWPRQETVTLAERLTVPLMAFTVWAYLPALAVHHLPFTVFTAAMGQCLLFTREAYDRIGGHGAVRDSVLDDIGLARAVKRSRGRLRMADSDGLIACRMYRDWPTVRDGFAKNILAGYGGSLIGLALATAFHWTILLLPWAWLATGLIAPAAVPAWPWWPLALCALGVAIRGATAAATGQRPLDALGLPLSALAFSVIAWRSVRWARSGGARWKGRVVPARGAGAAPDEPVGSR